MPPARLDTDDGIVSEQPEYYQNLEFKIIDPTNVTRCDLYRL